MLCFSNNTCISITASLWLCYQLGFATHVNNATSKPIAIHKFACIFYFSDLHRNTITIQRKIESPWSNMDPRNSAQDVARCTLCVMAVAPMHCDICHIDLCKDCVVNHISDVTKDHKVVPLKHRGPIPNYPKCLTHTTKHCELYCEQCDIPVCLQCFLWITQRALFYWCTEKAKNEKRCNAERFART